MDIPAVEDGKPVREEMLPAFLPMIGLEEIIEISDTLKSGWITTGPKVDEFENKFRDHIGCKSAVAVNSCTSAIHLALVVNDIGKGDEVITPPYTFVSTVNAIEYQGAKPVLADIDEETFNIDPERIKEKITENTKAIIPVHFAGQPCEMDEIVKIADEHNLTVIEDAAHAVGAEYKGKKIGTVSDYTCFSFYATKNLTTAEGGMITTDLDLSDKLKSLSLHGMDRDAWNRYAETGSWFYDVKYLGFKYNMTDLQAALGLCQLEKFEEMQERRIEIADRYNRSFKNTDEIITPRVKKDVKHAWHLYPILINEELMDIGRDEFIPALKEENIGSSVHFIPIHMMSYYRNKYGYRPEDFPMAKKMYEREISIPLYPKMNDEDVEDVVEGVKKLVEYYGR